MAQTAANVRVGVTGGIYLAPAGTTLPADATTALAGTFAELGFVTEDGVTQSIGADTQDIKAWQGGAIVRKIQTSHDLSYALAFLETNDAVLAAYYGTTVTDGAYEIRGEQGARGVWAIEVEDGDHIIRIVIPDGQITERGDVTFANGEAITYPVTITAYPDEDGVKAYVYSTDGVVAP